jgi:DNA-binding transcriptional LysR family regulator
MNVELRHMRYVVVLAEELHFSRAAERLMIAQPPLSQQVKKLEVQLGAELFRRTKRRVELTEAGRVFVEEARRTLAQAELTLRATQRAARGEIGRLAIGYAGSAAHRVLPSVMTRFRRQHPGVEIQLREMTTGEQVAALLGRRIDVGFVRPPVAEAALSVCVLVEEQFVAVLPRTHRLARLGRVPIGRLSGERFILFPRHMGPRLYDPIVAACQRAGFSPAVVQEAMHVPTIVGLVSAGVGVALLPESVRQLRWAGVAYRDLADCTARTAIAVASRPADESPAVRSFLAAARRTFDRTPQSASQKQQHD